MTDYDIRRIAVAVVELLSSDERFIRNIVKNAPAKKNLVTAAQAAQMLGVCRRSITNNAKALGGVKLSNGTWRFDENTLFDLYSKIEHYESKNKSPSAMCSLQKGTQQHQRTILP